MRCKRTAREMKEPSYIIKLSYPTSGVMHMEKLKEERDRTQPVISNQPATFVVKIIYSKNNSIQGYLHWLESEKSVPFRSYMELTHLINEALEASELIKFRSWQNAKRMATELKK